MIARAVLAGGALLAIGCPGGEVGTISLGLTEPPGSGLIADLAALRVVLTNPPQELTVPRTERGFDLSLDLDATGEMGALRIDGLDAAGTVVASGRSPRFPLAAIDARIVVYLAPPFSVELAPVALATPRTGAAAAPLTYGAVLAGGRLDGGAPSDAIEVYNAFDHTIAAGAPMPAPRAGVIPAVDGANRVYLYGGVGEGGAATGTLWHFDTTIAPAGRYLELVDEPALARDGVAAVPLAADRFAVPGAPGLEIGAVGAVQLPGLPDTWSGASVVDGARRIAIFVGHPLGGLIRLRDGEVEMLAGAMPLATATALPGARVAILRERTARVVDAVSGEVTVAVNALSRDYDAVVAAATADDLVVAGHSFGDTDATIDLVDADTLAPVRTVTLPGETISAAVALPTGQVLLVGAKLYLFTPPN